MSHFSVLVVANDEEDLHSKLLPYHEHECTGYDDYCEWVDDIHDNYLKEYNNDTAECVLYNGKVLGTKYGDLPIIKSMWQKESDDIFAKSVFVLKDGYDVANVPFKEIYSTFDEFMSVWCGHTEKNPETGKFERWTNLNAKWDWYEVGGRWSGKLTLKNGKSSDASLNKEISWGFMYERERNRLINEYREFHQYYDNYDPNIDKSQKKETWIKNYENWIERFPDVKKELSLDNHLKASFAFDALNWYLWTSEDVTRLLNKSESEYADEAERGLTYAFIDMNGNWNQKGEMGWWGMDDKTKCTESYDAEWWKFVQNLPDDVMVYVVDCHI